jgi:hypothetical protein
MLGTSRNFPIMLGNIACNNIQKLTNVDLLLLQKRQNLSATSETKGPFLEKKFGRHEMLTTDFRDNVCFLEHFSCRTFRENKHK